MFMSLPSHPTSPRGNHWRCLATTNLKSPASRPALSLYHAHRHGLQRPRIYMCVQRKWLEVQSLKPVREKTGCVSAVVTHALAASSVAWDSALRPAPPQLQFTPQQGHVLLCGWVQDQGFQHRSLDTWSLRAQVSDT